jgi:ADP-ribose pyrophosphatase YjhB (NUDIX family)
VDIKQLSSLPSPFYRVAVKVLIMDEQHRLLVTQNVEGQWEIPGGGWEHDETLELSVEREMQEELNAKVHDISDVEFVLRGQSSHGWHVIRLAVRATLDTGTELQPADDQVAFRYVNQDEFLQLPFCPADKPFQDAAGRIWSKS